MSEEDKHILSKILYYSDIHPADTDFINNIIYDLQQENKQLKEQINEYQKAVDETTSEKIDLQQENGKLTQLWLESQTKRRKAIEYIKENTLIDYYGMPCFNNQKNVEELLEILGDKENE